MLNSSVHRARQRLLRRSIDRRILDLSRLVRETAPEGVGRPVVFFNASTRLGGVSLNAAFATLSAMALQLSGVPVRYFACRAGLERCTLGVVVKGAEKAMPCRTCIAESQVLFNHAPVMWLGKPAASHELEGALKGLSLGQLERFEFQGIPLGDLTLASLRWTLRLYHLPVDEATARLFRSFIRSAYHLILAFDAFLERTGPRAVVVFNGISYPEAAARWVAIRRGLPVVTHEVAHQPLTAFFSHGQVTAYPVDIPAGFELSGPQNARLDEYLSRRFKGEFSMAGLEFWPEMEALDDALQGKIDSFSQLVPVFSNVIFDTAQVHANVVFEQMFAWLDQVAEIIVKNPRTLFVIRAHPDELRPNSTKQSRETVNDWFARSGLAGRSNVVYIAPDRYLSSYALIQQAKFVMVYNSTIGLEAALMGKPVLNGGKARYTQVDCVYLPKTADEHRATAQEFLDGEAVPMPDDFVRNARRFQYYQLWRTPLPFERYIEPHPTKGYVKLKEFPVETLNPEHSETMRVIVDGILDGKAFLMPEE